MSAIPSRGVAVLVRAPVRVCVQSAARHNQTQLTSVRSTILLKFDTKTVRRPRRSVLHSLTMQNEGRKINPYVNAPDYDMWLLAFKLIQNHIHSHTQCDWITGSNEAEYGLPLHCECTLRARHRAQKTIIFRYIIINTYRPKKCPLAHIHGLGSFISTHPLLSLRLWMAEYNSFSFNCVNSFNSLAEKSKRMLRWIDCAKGATVFLFTASALSAN